MVIFWLLFQIIVLSFTQQLTMCTAVSALYDRSQFNKGHRNTSFLLSRTRRTARNHKNSNNSLSKQSKILILEVILMDW